MLANTRIANDFIMARTTAPCPVIRRSHVDRPMAGWYFWSRPEGRLQEYSSTKVRSCAALIPAARISASHNLCNRNDGKS